MATVTVGGLKELGEALKAFPEVIGTKYLKRATFTAAAIIEADVASRTPVRTGALRDHIAIFKRKDDPNTAHYAIGVRGIKLTRKVKKVLRIMRKATGKRQSIVGDTYYWSFVEFGTARQPAQSFLRKGFEATKENAIEVFRTSLADGVVAAAAEVSKT